MSQTSKFLSCVFFVVSLIGLTCAQIPAPLHDYHPGCTSISQSRSSDCMAAMHRYCVDNKYGLAAYPQEVGQNEFGFLCTDTRWYNDVSYSEIPNCAGNTQSAACYSSAHRWCDKIDKSGVGMIQELGNGVVGLACVPYKWAGSVAISDLKKQHPGCSSPSAAQSPPCLAAVHRYCSSKGLGLGGAIMEVGRFDVTVGCISAARYKTAKVSE